MSAGRIVTAAFASLPLFAGFPAAAQDATRFDPPSWEHESRKLGPGFEHLKNQPPYNALGQYPALRGESPSAAAPREGPPPVPRCNPRPSVVPSYDRPNASSSPPSCPSN